MKHIPLTSISGIRIGQVEDAQAGTGVTVLIAPGGMAASIDVRGGGPASRDTRVLDPLAAAESIHAVVLGGGSAYGLDAAGGVMRCLHCRLLLGDINRLSEMGWSDNTAVTLLRFDKDNKVEVVFYNDSSHLPEELIPKRSRLSSFMGDEK